MGDSSPITLSPFLSAKKTPTWAKHLTWTKTQSDLDEDFDMVEHSTIHEDSDPLWLSHTSYYFTCHARRLAATQLTSPESPLAYFFISLEHFPAPPFLSSVSCTLYYPLSDTSLPSPYLCHGSSLTFRTVIASLRPSSLRRPCGVSTAVVRPPFDPYESSVPS